MTFNEDSSRSEYQQSPGLQVEFGDESTYMAYQRGTAAGRIIPPVVGRTVTAEPPTRREVDEQVTPPAPRVSSASPRQAAPDLRAIWDQHGPQSGRIQCSMLMSRFRSLSEFEQHVASHSREVAANGR